jgi:prenyltransferase beta subunit
MPATLAPAEFLHAQLRPGGGFANRAGAPDLYYTAFAVPLLTALDQPISPASREYLASFAPAIEGMDLVHLACLARAWAVLGEINPQRREAVHRRLAQYRSRDGGFGDQPGAACGTAYSAFLAAGAYEDIGTKLPRPGDLAAAVETLSTPDGGYANAADEPVGLAPSTAAAVMVLRIAGQEIDPSSADFLRARLAEDGGFYAADGAPVADLLSTATSLHALWAMGEPLNEPARARCRDFVLSLRHDNGGFRGSVLDDIADCEYTFYALLSLGHLGQ